MADVEKRIDELEELLGESGQDDEALVQMIRELEMIAGADIANLYNDEGEQLTPNLWPEAEKRAIIRFTPGPYGYSVVFQDRGRVYDQIAKLKGWHRPDDEQRNPMEKILDGVPREELVEVIKGLRALGDMADLDKEI